MKALSTILLFLALAFLFLSCTDISVESQQPQPVTVKTPDQVPTDSTMYLRFRGVHRNAPPGIDKEGDVYFNVDTGRMMMWYKNAWNSFF